MSKIAIDGPAGAGKSTIAKSVANSLGYIYIDTGAMYRCVGLAAIRNNIDINADTCAVEALMEGIDISVSYENGTQKIFLNGEDVSDTIRTPEASLAASAVSAIPKVREMLVSLQRKLASSQNVVMDGRDIGTVVFPDAEVKIFLTADPRVRAKRRFDELSQKGENVTFDDVLSDMIKRDKQDINRKVSPLKAAEDAVMLDTSDLTLQQSVDAVLKIVKDSGIYEL